MLTIEYNSETGAPIRDGDAEKFASAYIPLFQDESNVLHDIEREFTTGSEILINAFRVLIAEGKLPHDKIQFKFKGQILSPDLDGRLANWPHDFCSTSLKFCGRILRAPNQKDKIL